MFNIDLHRRRNFTPLLCGGSDCYIVCCMREGGRGRGREGRGETYIGCDMLCVCVCMCAHVPSEIM